MYKQFLKILQKSDDIYLFFLCENMSFNLGMNSTDTLYIADMLKKLLLISSQALYCTTWYKL